MSIKISVIVPIFEQWHFIPQLLKCLERQSYPRECFEVILVDNGSANLNVPPQVAPNVRISLCDVRGSYAARNQGIQEAQGDWLVFTDADCLPTEDWLSEIYMAIKSEKKSKIFFAGHVYAVSNSARATAYEIYDIVRGIPQAHYVKRGYAATANLAVPREVAISLGGFNSKLYSGGDADFCRRASALGWQITYIPSAVVGHRARMTWDAIVTKARRVKGGQLSCKPLGHRAWIVLRTVLSPLITAYRFLGAREHSFKYRLLAITVYIGVWLAEIVELFRIFSGKLPERR